MQKEHYIWLTATAILVVIYGTFLFDRPTPDSSRLMLAVVVFCGFVVPFLAYSGAHSWPGPAIALYAVGAYVLYSALNALGTHFSPTVQFQQGHQLLTTGIYGWIRHPVYTAFLIFAAAQALLLPSIVGWVSIALTVALVLFVRIPLEEKALSAEFGSQYHEYRKRVRALI